MASSKVKSGYCLTRPSRPNILLLHAPVLIVRSLLMAATWYDRRDRKRQILPSYSLYSTTTLDGSPEKVAAQSLSYIGFKL